MESPPKSSGNFKIRLNLGAPPAPVPAHEATDLPLAVLEEPAAESYCVCGASDGFLIECADATGGCNGWFHPVCCGLELSEEVMESIEQYSFTCSLCLAKQAAAPKGRGKRKAANKAAPAPAPPPAPARAPARAGSRARRAPVRSGDSDDDGGGGSDSGKVPGGVGGTGRSKRARASGGGFAAEADILEALKPERDLGPAEEVAESIMVVDKFLGRKMAPAPLTEAEAAAEAETDMMAALQRRAGGGATGPRRAARQLARPPAEWFLVKWRGLSYVHVSWEVAADIEAVDLQVRPCARRCVARGTGCAGKERARAPMSRRLL